MFKFIDCQTATDLGSPFAESLACFFVCTLFANFDPAKVAAYSNTRALGSFQKPSTMFLDPFDHTAGNLGLVGALRTQVHGLVLTDDAAKILIASVKISWRSSSTQHVSVVNFVDQVCGRTWCWIDR
jgi:hypothetical protein